MSLDGPRVAPAAGGVATSLVILLHGYGSNGADLIGLVPYWRARLPGTAFISPNAPEPCPGAPGGFQWWGFTGTGGESRAAGAARAAPVLDAFIDEELAKAGLSDGRLALVGFSQGTMMALQVGPRRRHPIAGIVGYSGMLAGAEELGAQLTHRPPVLLVHGDADPMIPLAAFHTTKAALEGLDFVVASHVSPGLTHSIDAAGLELGARFLERVLG